MASEGLGPEGSARVGMPDVSMSLLKLELILEKATAEWESKGRPAGVPLDDVKREFK